MFTLLLLAASAAQPPGGRQPPADVRAAVREALPVLWAGADGHSAERSCFTCHHHAVPLLAFTTAKAKGFEVPADKLAELIEFVREDVAGLRPRLLAGQGPGPSPVGGGVDNTGYMLLALAAAGHAPDDVTDAVVEFTLGFQKGRGHWTTPAPRPPTEASSFTTTALCVAGLRRYAGPAHRERADDRIARSRDWLRTATPKDTEDRVFRLVGLHAAGATADDIRAAADDLAGRQRADGGWGQTDPLASDAYATATALYALHTAGGRATGSPEYRRGVGFLLAGQLADGSWHVTTRSGRKVQKYFETGFPHGADQFISCAATGWAATALALAGP